MRPLLLTLALLTLASSSTAATIWVDDTIRITLRTGQGTSFQILRTLPSGTPLELLEEGAEWSKVRTRGGTEGWILNQYISREPIAAEQLANAQQRLTALEQERTALRQQVGELTAERDHDSKQLQQLGDERDQLRRQITELERLTAAPRRLANENQQLQRRTVELEQQLQQLQLENQALHNSEQRKWFITGGGVAGGGLLAGLLLPLFAQRRRRSNWSDL